MSSNAAFFQPGTTYLRGRWHFQCLAVARDPFTGTAKAVGFLFRSDETATSAAFDASHWAHGEWQPQPARIPAETSSTVSAHVLLSTVAAHVLFSEGHPGGYPAGSFVAALLRAWNLADDANAARFAAGWPDYAAALQLLTEPGGVPRLQAIAASGR